MTPRVLGCIGNICFQPDVEIEVPAGLEYLALERYRRRQCDISPEDAMAAGLKLPKRDPDRSGLRKVRDHGRERELPLAEAERAAWDGAEPIGWTPREEPAAFFRRLQCGVFSNQLELLSERRALEMEMANGGIILRDAVRLKAGGVVADYDVATGIRLVRDRSAEIVAADAPLGPVDPPPPKKSRPA
jgi:hypothetical protein